MGCWSALFLVLLGSGYVQAPHEGNSPKFWREAVREHKPLAAAGLVEVLQQKARFAPPTAAASAWNELGTMHRDGTDVGQDLPQAAREFNKAARLGNVAGAANLAALVLDGRATRPDGDVRFALELLEAECRRGPRAAHDGLGQGQIAALVGRAYESGRGVPADPGRALEFYRQGCDQGDPTACGALARLQRPESDVPVAHR
jgi:TPR repeat protein